MKKNCRIGKEIMDLIRSILINDWDPLDVGNNPALRDEYDSYIPEIFHLVTKGSDKRRIADALEEIENQKLKTECDKSRLSIASEKLVVLKSRIDSMLAELYSNK